MPLQKQAFILCKTKRVLSECTMVKEGFKRKSVQFGKSD